MLHGAERETSQGTPTSRFPKPDCPGRVTAGPRCFCPSKRCRGRPPHTAARSTSGIGGGGEIYLQCRFRHSLGARALAAVPDAEPLLPLDLALQLQDAVEQGLGRGRAACRERASVSPPCSLPPSSVQGQRGGLGQSPGPENDLSAPSAGQTDSSGELTARHTGVPAFGEVPRAGPGPASGLPLGPLPIGAPVRSRTPMGLTASHLSRFQTL